MLRSISFTTRRRTRHRRHSTRHPRAALRHRRERIRLRRRRDRMGCIRLRSRSLMSSSRRRWTGDDGITVGRILGADRVRIGRARAVGLSISRALLWRRLRVLLLSSTTAILPSSASTRRSAITSPSRSRRNTSIHVKLPIPIPSPTRILLPAHRRYNTRQRAIDQIRQNEQRNPNREEWIPRSSSRFFSPFGGGHTE